MDIVSITVLVLVCLVVIQTFLYFQRKKYLMQKYGDAALVARLMRRMFWTGQTQDQLIDSLGRPQEVDRRVMKTKVREVWKYNRRTRTRFGLRITLEDGYVIGWDKKA